ncbi:hypothetical protein BDZ97DRAFT_437799 [Flammula alnicola]|nr:hypothetical protein BDZ97DRAFT_437799 [Flammula alnicola]
MENLPLYDSRSERGQSRWRKATGHNLNRTIMRQRMDIVAVLCIAVFLISTVQLAIALSIPEVWSYLFRCWVSTPMFLKCRADLSITEPSWEGLKGGEHCLRYATREYTAKLADVPPGQDSMRICKDTPVEIHDRVLFTDFCQDLGFGRGVWGFWIVDFDEPDCETRWGEFTDVGCLDAIPPSVRRVESRLENLQPGSSWQFMCVTTPADIYGHNFQTRSECFKLGKSDIYGTWNLPNSSCD